MSATRKSRRGTLLEATARTRRAVSCQEHQTQTPPARCATPLPLIRKSQPLCAYLPLADILGEYLRLQTLSLNKAGFKPVFYAEAWGALNSSGWNNVETAIFDGWDQGTPGSVATQISNGAHVVVSSYCFLAPTQGCPDNLRGGLTPDQWSNRACEIQNKSLFPPSAWPSLGNLHGGHPARWGEQTDGTNIFQFTWPALMGAAEVLWSPYNTTADASISRSLAWRVVRCLMVRRGVPVDPRSGGGNSCDFEFEPPYPPLTLLSPNPANSSWLNLT